MMGKTKIGAAVALAGALILGTVAAPAYAATFDGGPLSCANRVTLWSEGNGIQYHELSGVPLATYPSTSAITTRISTRNQSYESGWYVAISGTANYGYPRCNG